jgi:hypothetical protein
VNLNYVNELEFPDYAHLREVPGRGLCGLHRFIFTTGLVVGITREGYIGRYCYSSWQDAHSALKKWDGVNDPDGDWIKYKGLDFEYSNSADEFQL